jgi:hypothetical protein
MTDLLRDLEAAVAIDRDKRILSSEGEGRSADALLRKFQSRAGDFIRTHHAEIAEALKDARRYRWLRDHSVGQWQYPICVSQERTFRDDMRYVGPLIGAGLDQAIDAAMHNSAREAGE